MTCFVFLFYIYKWICWFLCASGSFKRKYSNWKNILQGESLNYGHRGYTPYELRNLWAQSSSKLFLNYFFSALQGSPFHCCEVIFMFRLLKRCQLDLRRWYLKIHWRNLLWLFLRTLFPRAWPLSHAFFFLVSRTTMI